LRAPKNRPQGPPKNILVLSYPVQGPIQSSDGSKEESGTVFEMKAIGKYQLLEKIGEGAAGITYRARDSFRNRELALKVLHPSLVANPEWKEQFSKELGLCGDLRHSIFVKILDLGEVEDVIYIATDLLSGVDLRCHLAERRVLRLDQNLEYIAQVCDGLAFAHSKGIAHGNIKPSNLFVIAGKDARILDLGLAGWLSSVLASNGQQVELFPNYFAPEQILGQAFDARSDIFSVAVVLYELLTQKYPFEAAANLVTREIVHAEPEPLRKIDPKLPEELEQLVARALHKDPAQRPASAEELGAELLRIAQKLRDEEQPGSLLGMTPRPSLVVSPRPEALVPVSPLAGQTEDAGLVVALPPPVGALDITPRPPSPPLRPAAPGPAETSPVPMIEAPAQNAPPIVRPAAPPKPAAPATNPLLSSAPALLQKPGVMIAAAAVLALCIVVAFLSRQGLRAAPPKSAPPVIHAQAPIPETKAVPPPAAPAAVEEPPAAKPAADPKPAPVEPSPADILRGKVKPLWESGKYEQALKVVNDVLADDPHQVEALAWKKKIRAAQDAEAAIK
jgi:eukaryotic-like serine/threonine-protein kinase